MMEPSKVEEHWDLRSASANALKSARCDRVADDSGSPMMPPSPQPSAPGSSIMGWSIAGSTAGGSGSSPGPSTVRSRPSSTTLARRFSSKELTADDQSGRQGPSAPPAARRPPSNESNHSSEQQSAREHARLWLETTQSKVWTDSPLVPARSAAGTNQILRVQESPSSSCVGSSSPSTDESIQVPVDLSASFLDASAEIDWLVKQRSTTHEARTAARLQASSAALLTHPEDAQGAEEGAHADLDALDATSSPLCSAKKVKRSMVVIS